MKLSDMYGRVNSDNNIDVLWADDGSRVAKFEDNLPLVWPINSNVSAYHEHINGGIVITREDAAKMGLHIEN